MLCICTHSMSSMSTFSKTHFLASLSKTWITLLFIFAINIISFNNHLTNFHYKVSTHVAESEKKKKHTLGVWYWYHCKYHKSLCMYNKWIFNIFFCKSSPLYENIVLNNSCHFVCHILWTLSVLKVRLTSMFLKGYFLFYLTTIKQLLLLLFVCTHTLL